MSVMAGEQIEGLFIVVDAKASFREAREEDALLSIPLDHRGYFATEPLVLFCQNKINATDALTANRPFCYKVQKDWTG